MSQPQRVTVTGSRFNPHVPDDAVYVGRHGPYLKRSPFHNPYPVKTYGLDESLRRFRHRIFSSHRHLIERARAELAGHDLACRCPPNAEWCHAEDWLILANARTAYDGVAELTTDLVCRNVAAAGYGVYDSATGHYESLPGAEEAAADCRRLFLGEPIKGPSITIPDTEQEPTP